MYFSTGIVYSGGGGRVLDIFSLSSVQNFSLSSVQDFSLSSPQARV